MYDREAIRDGAFTALTTEGARLGLLRPLTADQRLASRRAIMEAAEPGADIWVFGYGSLMWRPAFHFVERQPALLHGYHRSFCLWVPIGRGSPDNPGLMLALDNGGACRGVGYRIAAAKLAEELDIVWAREMLTDAYRPRWVRVRTHDGLMRATTFVINHAGDRYAGRLPPHTVARHLATAAGSLGSCADYLANTVSHLDELGIREGPPHDLLNRVRQIQSRRARTEEMR